MKNKYYYLEKIYKELRKKGYSSNETINYLVRTNVLARNKQQLIPNVSIKRLKEILREAEKERIIL